LIRPEDQSLAHVGRDNWSRNVRTILGPEQTASRLLLGETVNPPGQWSSYPPHKHDVQAPPDEVRLEEVYLFKLDPPGGFGVQINYDDEGKDDAALVRTDDVAVISSGYHPVVAAPGYALYYLWIMAGEGRAMAPHFDTRHAWVQQA
jgi:5-deoxy-glucuronate isomerase